jgi:hypothetical protein
MEKKNVKQFPCSAARTLRLFLAAPAAFISRRLPALFVEAATSRKMKKKSTEDYLFSSSAGKNRRW